MKRILIMVAFCCLILTANSVSGDTGTYKISEYNVKLTPRSDGMVEIEYHQKWNVTGGHIPWITVGVPNKNFEIVQAKNKGAIKKIKSDSSGDWSGVRIDLDKDYKPGDSFDVWFGIVQRQLFYADKDNYKLDFTPGWYDKAETVNLKLEVFFFAKLDTVTAKPKPTKIEGQSMIWEKSNLKKGEKFDISVSFPKKIFPKEISKKELRSEFPRWAIALIIIIVIVIILVIALGVIASESDDGYSGGSIFYSGGRGSSGGISSSGGGGFGGRSSSCACACVSCACACACAGGGGAGCDRKLTNRCPLCKNCEKKENCLLWKGGDS